MVPILLSACCPGQSVCSVRPSQMGRINGLLLHSAASLVRAQHCLVREAQPLDKSVQGPEPNHLGAGNVACPCWCPLGLPSPA